MLNKIRDIFSIVLIASIFLGRSPLPALESGSDKRPFERDQEQPQTIKKVLDGDTFVLSNNERVRLIGVDTPEQGEPFSDAARRFADSVLVGAKIRVENDKPQRDKYDRILAYVFVDDSLLFNELLLRRGLANAYLFKENKRLVKRLISAQNEARKFKRGIWSIDKPSDEPYYISAGGSFRFHRPLCTLIKNINQKKASRYKNRDAALDKGLSPCRECRP
jgi:micrococcal nuclease